MGDIIEKELYPREISCYIALKNNGVIQQKKESKPLYPTHKQKLKSIVRTRRHTHDRLKGPKAYRYRPKTREEANKRRRSS